LFTDVDALSLNEAALPYQQQQQQQHQVTGEYPAANLKRSVP